MVWLGAVLCNTEFEADEMKENFCERCNKCVEACPINALENEEMNQTICWDYAFGNDKEKNVWRIACHKCRDACPHNFGTKNSF